MKTNQIIDQALKIKSGDKLDIIELNDLVANLILEACNEKEIKESAKRIAKDKFSYELKQLEEEENALMERLVVLNAPRSPLDL